MLSDVTTRPDLTDPLSSAARDPASRSAPRTAPLRDVSPRLLRCFVALADELHFGRAADRLYVAQPALSRSIQQLERILDRRLFVRTTRAVELTPSGHRLLPAARDVLDSLSSLTRDLAAAHTTLHVAHNPGSDTLALVLDALARTASQVQVHESTMTGPEQLQALSDGRIDVAICCAQGPLDRQFRAELLRLDPLLVAVLGRAADVDRPVDCRRRTVAVADAGPADPDYARFVAGYERAQGCELRRVAIAHGSGTEAYALRRAGATAFVTLASHGDIRLDRSCPAVGAVSLQPYFPWSLVSRRSQRSPAVDQFFAAARYVAETNRWLDTSSLPGEAWIPDHDPIARGAWPIAA